MLVDLYLSLGSNMGDRAANIENAVSLLNIELKTPYKAISSLLETEPWGFESQHPFLNLGIAIDTDIAPEELITQLLNIEKSICSASHRDENGDYIDRMIDIDLIAVDDLVINTPQLQLPHPRMHLRDFVLTPMMHLSPSWLHPILKLTISQLHSQLHEKDNQSMD